MRRTTCLTVSRFSLLCLSALAVPAAASAQGGFLSRPTVGVFGGVTLPRGDLSDEAKTGWHGGALGKIRIRGPLDLRIDGTYAKFGHKDIVGDSATVSTDGVFTFGTLNGLLNLGADSAAYPGDNTVSPYLLAGGGIYRVDFDAVCTGTCGSFENPGVDNYLGFNIGFGATVPLVGLRTFIEGRYHRILRDDLDGGTRSMVLGSIGIKFR